MNVKLIRFFDRTFLSAFCFIAGISRIFPKKLKTNRILVIKLWALGDSIVSLSMIRGLRKNLPKAEIDVLCHERNKAPFMDNKDINKIIEFRVSSIFKLFRKYDLCIDTEPYLNVSALISLWCARYRAGFSHGIRSLLYSSRTEFSKKQHMVQNYLDMIRKLGFNYDADKLVKLETTKAEKAAVEKFLKKNKLSKNDFIVGITPGVAESVKTRMWPLERMAELADKISGKHNAKIIIIDSPANKGEAEKMASKMKTKPIFCIGDLSIREVFNLVERCRIYICNDTGPMHIAAAQGVKTIGLFGPNTPVLWGPYGEKNISIYHPPWCSPCIDNAKGKMPKCFNKVYQQCMKNISVDEVMKAFEKLKNAK